MEYTIPQIVLMIFGIALYFVKPSWLMLLWLLSTPILAPFIVLFSGVTDFVEQQQLVWNLWGVFNWIFLFAIVFELMRGHQFGKSIKPLFLPVGLLFVFFVIHNLTTHYYPLTIFNECIYIVYALVPLFVFLLNKKTWPSLKEVFVVVVAICIIQLIFMPLNMRGIYTYTGKYQELILGGNESHVLSGTFTRSNMMADWLAVVYLFITIDYFFRRSISLIKYLVISIIIIVPMLFAGSKLPIIVTVANLLMCFVTFKKGKLVAVGFVLLISWLMLNFLMSNKSEEISSNEGVNRIVGELSDFTQSRSKKNGNDETTFKFSEDLLERYFWVSPLIGHGNAYNGAENAYTSILTLSSLKSDATLAFYLVEYGIIGLFLFLFFQYKVIKLSSFPIKEKNRKSVICIIFIYFLLFAVTERGLFDRNYFIFTFIYMFGLARENESNITNINGRNVKQLFKNAYENVGVQNNKSS